MSDTPDSAGPAFPKEPLLDYSALLQTGNASWLCSVASRLTVMSWIMTNYPTWPELVEIADFPGERITDYYPDNDRYVQLCSQIWERAGGPDTGCSSGMHANYEFVSVVVQRCALAYWGDEGKRLRAQAAEYRKRADEADTEAVSAEKRKREAQPE